MAFLQVHLSPLSKRWEEDIQNSRQAGAFGFLRLPSASFGLSVQSSDFLLLFR